MSVVVQKLTVLEHVLWQDFVSVRKRPTLAQLRDIWLSVAEIRSNATTGGIPCHHEWVHPGTEPRATHCAKCGVAATKENGGYP